MWRQWFEPLRLTGFERLDTLVLKRREVAVAGADDVAVALQHLQDQIQSRPGHVEAVALPDRRQDVQDVATLLCICGAQRRFHFRRIQITATAFKVSVRLKSVYIKGIVWPFLWFWRERALKEWISPTAL